MNDSDAASKHEPGSIRYAMETICFFDAIRLAWCAETSADPEYWSPANPAWGQCAVTALVVQDGLGGELLRSTVGEVSHYWNRIDGGGQLDLTRSQFSSDYELWSPPDVREREYVLSFPATVARYELLRKRMGL